MVGSSGGRGAMGARAGEREEEEGEERGLSVSRDTMASVVPGREQTKRT